MIRLPICKPPSLDRLLKAMIAVVLAVYIFAIFWIVSPFLTICIIPLVGGIRSMSPGRMIERAVKSLTKNDAMISRDQWLHEAESAEAAGAP